MTGEHGRDGKENKKNKADRTGKINNAERAKNSICLIISGGSFCDLPREVLKADYVIACDKGVEYADRYGIEPDILIGDFDSVSGDTLDSIDDRSVPVMRYPKEKDYTDTFIAVKHALDEGYRELVLVCAMGGRTDHAFANIQTAHYAAKKGAIVRIYDVKEEMIVFNNTHVIINEGALRRNMSVFSLDDRCEGVSIKGTKYELDDAVLTNSFPIGVSNEFKKKQAAISVKKGSLLVIVSDDCL